MSIRVQFCTRIGYRESRYSSPLSTCKEDSLGSTGKGRWAFLWIFKTSRQHYQCSSWKNNADSHACLQTRQRNNDFIPANLSWTLSCSVRPIDRTLIMQNNHPFTGAVCSTRRARDDRACSTDEPWVVPDTSEKMGAAVLPLHQVFLLILFYISIFIPTQLLRDCQSTLGLQVRYQ